MAARGLTVYTGPMFSAKSSHLIADLNKYKMIRPRNVAAIEPVVTYITSRRDTRDYTTRGGHIRLADGIQQIRTDKLGEVTMTRGQVVGIDEAQFFDDLPLITSWVDNGDCHVIVAGLVGDFQRRPFGRIHELLPHVDAGRFHILPAVCQICIERGEGEREASFTRRYREEGQVEEIGGADKYYPVCRKHFNE